MRRRRRRWEAKVEEDDTQQPVQTLSLQTLYYCKQRAPADSPGTGGSRHTHHIKPETYFGLELPWLTLRRPPKSLTSVNLR